MERFLDPIVEETRRTRQHIWEEGGGTLAGLWTLLENGDRRQKLRKAIEAPESEAELATAGTDPDSGKLIAKGP